MGKVINYENKLNKLAQMYENGYLSMKHEKQYIGLAGWKIEEIKKLQPPLPTMGCRIKAMFNSRIN